MAEDVRALGIPPDVQEDGGSEVLRVFVSNGGLSVSLIRAFDEPDTWGLLLADLVRHAARIYARETDLSEEEAEAKILSMFQAEFENPTDLGTTKARN